MNELYLDNWIACTLAFVTGLSIKLCSLQTSFMLVQYIFKAFSQRTVRDIVKYQGTVYKDSRSRFWLANDIIWVDKESILIGFAPAEEVTQCVYLHNKVF